MVRDIRHHHFLKGLVWRARRAGAGRVSRLVFSEVVGNGGTYAYYICTGRQSGLCGLPSLPLAEVERAVAKSFGGEQLGGDFLDQLKAEVRDTVRQATEHQVEMRASLAKQIKKLDIHEERLLDLAADGELSTPKLKQRLQQIKLERADLQERLEHADIGLARGAQTIETYIEMLENPAALYGEADDLSRRELLDAFYGAIKLDMDDQVEASVARPSENCTTPSAHIAMRLPTPRLPRARTPIFDGGSC